VGIGVALCVASFFLKRMAHGAFDENPEVMSHAPKTAE
jgi:hypothetical protein